MLFVEKDKTTEGEEAVPGQGALDSYVLDLLSAHS